MRSEIREILQLLEREAYVGDRAIATSIHLSIALQKPLLIEGHAGVGKTEIAKVLARSLGTELIRLQCYEGLDATDALYEWNYPKQLLRIRMEEGSVRSVEEREETIFGDGFLLRRPLLRAITAPERAPVLLIDEIDRADEEFEAFLLEVLADFQVTIPEIGTIPATHRPHVVLTSNRTRHLSDALRRRCLYLWIDHPSLEKELQIVRGKVNGINDRLAGEITGFLQSIRTLALNKVPGVSETLDWARALVALHAAHLDEEVVRETLGCFLKDQSDIGRIEAELDAGHLSALLAPAG